MVSRSYFSELFAGKSVPRALLAEACSGIRLKGEGVDLGSRNSFGLQYRYIDTSEATITYTDMNPTHTSVVKVDVERDLPFSDQSFDFVLMFYLLEHVYNLNTVLSESARVLKPGGRLIGVVPQLERFHPDPDDYFRFTRSGLTRMLQDTGFDDVKLKPLGLGPFTAGAHIATSATKLRLPAALAGTMLDLLTTKLLRRRWQQTYTLSFFFEAAIEAP